MGYRSKFLVVILIVGYWEFSVTLHPSTMPGCTQIAILRRIGYTCYGRLLCQIVGSKVGQPLHAARFAMPRTFAIFHYHTPMYIRSTSSNEYEVIL